MADLLVRDDLVMRLRDLAHSENRLVDEVLETLLDQYQPQISPERQLRLKLYVLARTYWQQIGDQERLALTDAQLDEQFWLIDPEGIPRLKSDQRAVELPPDPLEAFVGLFDSDITDASTTARETLNAYYQSKHGRPD